MNEMHTRNATSETVKTPIDESKLLQLINDMVGSWQEDCYDDFTDSVRDIDNLVYDSGFEFELSRMELLRWSKEGYDGNEILTLIKNKGVETFKPCEATQWLKTRGVESTLQADGFRSFKSKMGNNTLRFKKFTDEGYTVYLKNSQNVIAAEWHHLHIDSFKIMIKGFN